MSDSKYKKIKILHLEDSPKDSELIISLIDAGDIINEYIMVDNKKDFIKILETDTIDIILSDYSLPDYNGNEALLLVKEKYSHIPFIFVSGAMGEDAAINAMVNGATDYVLKNKLERLVPAIKRAMNEHELRIQRIEAEKQLILANKELVYQNREKEKRSNELVIANKELIFQNEEKEKRANELDVANIELAFQNEEKEKRADELIVANKELAFQNEEKEKRANELFVANKELAFQNEEKEKRANELDVANIELAFQNEEKEKRANELFVANKELAFQNEEKEKRANELDVANIELAFQNKEKEKRANELDVANIELAFQNEEKEKRANELFVANKELAFQNEEKEKRAEELIIAKEKAEESDSLKTAFLQNLTHEIRTPLNGIIGFSNLLYDDQIKREEIIEYTDIINQSGRRLLEIVNNVLEISRIQTGQIKVENEPTAINAICEDFINFFNPQAKEKEIVLTYKNKNQNEIIINTDEIKLHQILTNLIKNAIKFTKAGNIDFGYTIKDDIIQFYVKDTGIGIPKDLHSKIFDRFTQAEMSISRGYEGAGLGLAICKEFLNIMGGQIWIESEVNKGTTFFFTLPYSPVSFTDEIEVSNLKGNIENERGKILIVEDDWVSFHYLSKYILNNSKITLMHAENGFDAVEMVKNNLDIDLILMDIKMPVMDGIEATKIIKSMRPDLPIIAQTAYAFREEKANILSIGCNDYLSKPLDSNKVNLLIEKYLN